MKNDKCCPSCGCNFKINPPVKSLIKGKVICKSCKKRFDKSSIINTQEKLVKTLKTKRLEYIKNYKPTGYFWRKIDLLKAANNESFICTNYGTFHNDNLKVGKNMFQPQASKI